MHENKKVTPNNLRFGVGYGVGLGVGGGVILYVGF